MCHLIWLLSRKYGTVWYHPASSKLWYLTLYLLLIFRKNWLARLSLSVRVKPALFGLLCDCVECTFHVNSYGPLSSVDACGSLALVTCCADSGTTSSTVGPRLRLLSVAPPTVSQFSSSPWSTGSDDGISCDSSKLNYQHARHHCDNPPRKILYYRLRPIQFGH
jgi:hypothetical protein